MRSEDFGHVRIKCLAFLLAVSACWLTGCSLLNPDGASKSTPALRALQSVKEKYAPDSHLAIFNVGLQRRGAELILTGEVDRAEAKLEAVRAVERTGIKVTDRIDVLPSERLGEKLWGISCVSVASGRELPDHKAEMGTQILMGNVVRLWNRTTNANFTWYLGQSADGYLSWLERETLFRCTREQVQAWERAPLLIVTASEDIVLEKAEGGAQPVSDVVTGDLVKMTREE